jgi:hydrogenase/urease accessory protein HupE
MDVFLLYLELGFTHILPLGLDHILFIVSLVLLSPALKPILWQATAFTVAHSLTLALAMSGMVALSSSVVEPIIALSIVYVALENIFTHQLKPSRLIVIFAFGLIHGLGFAGVLKDLGFPEGQFVNALLSFNLGVELGQLVIVFSFWFLIVRWFNKKVWYRTVIVIPFSVIIACMGLYWTMERLFF